MALAGSSFFVAVQHTTCSILLVDRGGGGDAFMSAAQPHTTHGPRAGSVVPTPITYWCTFLLCRMVQVLVNRKKKTANRRERISFRLAV